MITEPELLNERLERLAMVLDEIMPNCASLVRDAVALLKEQEHKDKMFHALEDDWKTLKKLLKEQEAETEWCERCGRVRLKSKWEGR